jgi:S1-C subfamily serine protease
MDAFKKIFILFIACFIFLSCAHNKHETSVNQILPRKSFAFIKKTVIIRSCLKKICSNDKVRAVGSGIVVANNSQGSYILTAGHLCNAPAIPKIFQNKLSVKNEMQIVDMDGDDYDAEIVDYKFDDKLDVCILRAKDADLEPVKIAKTMTKKGDKIYNLAAPLGIWVEGMVPILEGRYLGEMYSHALYSVPAAPGSSGSGLFNHRGELVGIVHSVFMRFKNISLSVPQEKMIKFIKLTVEGDYDYDKEDEDEDEEEEPDDEVDESDIDFP